MAKKRRRVLAVDVDAPEAMRARAHTRNMAEVDTEGPGNLRDGTCCVHEVGRGSSGAVHLGVFVPTLRMVAVKELSVQDEEHEQKTMEELHAVHEQLVPIDAKGVPVWLFHYHHSIGDVHPCPQIVSFYGSWANREANTVSLVLEYMHGGSLAQLAVPLRSEPLLRFILAACLQALAHLERHETLHRDIKPANILVNRDGDVKLGDLGLARHRAVETGGEGTSLYLSPERLQGKTYSYGADVWSLGITLITLATGRHPFGSISSMVGSQTNGGSGDSASAAPNFLALMDAVVNQPSPTLPSSGVGSEHDAGEVEVATVVGTSLSTHLQVPAGVRWTDGSAGNAGFSPALRDMVDRMLTKNPAERWHAAQLMQHPFMHGSAGDVCSDTARKELIQALGVKGRGQVEVHRVVQAVHQHQRHPNQRNSSGPPPSKSLRSATSSPPSAAALHWRTLRSKLGTVMPASCGGLATVAAATTSGASKLISEWEAVVDLAHSLDVPREQLIDELLHC